MWSGQQTVEEPLLDVGGECRATRDAAEQHALHDGAGEGEVEEVVDLREVRQAHRLPERRASRAAKNSGKINDG